MKFLSATYDRNHGELRGITWNPLFKAENLLLQADVLQDLLVAVETAYKQTLLDMRMEFGAKREAAEAQRTAPEPGQPVQLAFDFDTQVD